MLDLRSEAFSSTDVCRLAKVSFRQLDYWARTGLVTPSIQEATSSGIHRRWSRSDVVVVAAIAQLGQWWVRRLVAPEVRHAVDVASGWLVLDVADRRAWIMVDHTDLLRILNEDSTGIVTVIPFRTLVDFDA